MLDDMTAAKQNLIKSDDDAFILFVMSHGSRGKVYGTDGNSVDIENEIINMFGNDKCPTLVGKPKLLFINACQDGELINILQYIRLTRVFLTSLMLVFTTILLIYFFLMLYQ